MKPQTWLFAFLAVLTALRLFLAGQAELSPDEAYYYMWSQRPDLSYYSKGPGVAQVIRAGTALFGANEFGVRFFAPLLAFGTSLILYFFTRRLYGQTVAIWTVLTMNMIPIFNAGGLVMTIDPLSIFFWAAALWTFWLALENSPRFTGWWLLTGLLIGLGFLCKYTNAMQLLSIVLLMGCTPKFRREFARPGFYVMLAAFGICLLPPVIWNQRHEWITMTHLGARGGLDSAYAIRPGELLEFIGAHFGVYSPLIFAGLLIPVWPALKSWSQLKPRFLLIFGLPLLLLYLALSLKQAGEANWTAPAFISLGILAGAFWHQKALIEKRAAIFAVAALVGGLVISLMVLNTDLLRLAGVPWPHAKDPGSRLRGWKSAAAAVDEFRRNYERETGAPVFLIANKYQTAAALSFYLPEKRVEGAGHPPVYIPESQTIENQFSFWPRYDEFVFAPETGAVNTYDSEQPGINPFMGRNALYVTDRLEENPPSSIKGGFESVAHLELQRRGEPLRILRIFACQNYRSMPL
jgi:hypothetical protein